MGEYAYYQGQRVKIGTCENLTDLRAEHVSQITGYDFGRATLEGVRFRFPFPEEDGMVPGRVDSSADLDKCLNVPGAEFDHATYDHSTIHLSTGEGGLNTKTGNNVRVSFPCPLSPRGAAIAEAAELNFFGTPRGVNIVQQRAWDGMLVLVCACPACGRRFRLPTLADVAPVLAAVDAQAEAYRQDAARAANRADMWRKEGNDRRAAGEDTEARENTQRATYWDTISDRILAGYTNPPAFVAVTAPADADA